MFGSGLATGFHIHDGTDLVVRQRELDAKLPVDEIVPMVFRTGLAASQIPREFGFPGCRGAIGISLDTGRGNHHPPLDGARYVFPGYGKDWDAKNFSSIQNELR